MVSQLHQKNTPSLVNCIFNGSVPSGARARAGTVLDARPASKNQSDCCLYVCDQGCHWVTQVTKRTTNSCQRVIPVVLVVIYVPCLTCKNRVRLTAQWQ